MEEEVQNLSYKEETFEDDPFNTTKRHAASRRGIGPEIPRIANLCAPVQGL